MEKLIAFHCAPALAGIKPANLVSCHKSKVPEVLRELEKLNAQMNCKGIFFENLCDCENRVLVLVYRRSLLEKLLRQSDKKLFLAACGYPNDASLRDNLDFLKKRITNAEFPHEIGIFLGYPIHDIQGFLYHKEWGCLLCGDWKVYKDAEKAKILFKRYKNCRNALLKKVIEGRTLAQIFCAV